MDTTLRDGEQTSSVSFSATEKLTISKLLISELSVDRIEIASARVSDGEFHSVKKICDWARENEYLEKIEVLTFLDDGLSLDWINKSGCKVQNLLTKGSLNHLENQLNQKPYEHFEKIEKILNKADKNKILTNVYLEDWSNGMKKSKEYVLSLLDFLSKSSVKRVMLPDTLGILTPKETADFVFEITSKYPKIHLVIPTVVSVEGLLRKETLGWETPVSIITDPEMKLNALASSSVALAASGTVTLELALAKVPSVVAYKVNPLSAIIGCFLVNKDAVVLPNKLIGKEIFPLYLQWKCTPNNLYKAATQKIEYPTDQLIEVSDAIRNMLRANGQSSQSLAAQTIISLVEGGKM